MRALVVMFLVAGGCSFSGTNPVGDGDGGGDGDGDGDADASIGGSDSGVDAGRLPAMAGPEVRMTDSAGDGQDPVIVWTGTEFGVAWSDDTSGEDEIFFARVDVAGALVAPPTALTDTGSRSSEPSMAWNGTHFGIVWRDERNGNDEIYFTSLDATGATVVDDLRITNDGGSSRDPAIVWTGAEFVVAWEDDRDGNSEIYFARLDGAGTKLDVDQRLTNAAGTSERPSVAWSGTELAIAWNDDRDGDREILFARIDANDLQLGADTIVTATLTDAERPSLVWTGSEYGLAWHDQRDGNREIYFARLDAVGAVVGAEVRITSSAADSERPSLSWLGTEYGVVWIEGGATDEVEFVGIDAAGSVIGQAMQTTSAAGDSNDPALAGAGSQLLIGWSDNRDGNDEIYAQTLAP